MILQRANMGSWGVHSWPSRLRRSGWYWLSICRNLILISRNEWNLILTDTDYQVEILYWLPLIAIYHNKLPKITNNIKSCHKFFSSQMYNSSPWVYSIMIAMTRKTAGTPIIALKRATTHQLDHTSIAIFGMQVWQYLFFQVREGLI